MKLLFLGDMSGTGFGTVTQDLGRELLARGVDVRFVSLNENPDEVPDPFFAPLTATLGTSDGWLGLADPVKTAERLEGMFRGLLFPDGWTPDVGFIIGDVASIQQSPLIKFVPAGFPVYHYVPIEGIGLPPRWGEFWKVFRPIACSEFGADQIEKMIGTRPPVVYHGVDTSVFHPVSIANPIVITMGKELRVLRTKADCRKLLGWPQDETILFRADRNMPRKNYWYMLAAIAPILAEDRKVRMIWHCATVDWGGNLADERSGFPSFIGERMNSTGFHDAAGGVDRKLLAAMYNAADLYLSTGAEGFGLTIAESIACGVPAVGLRYSSVPEVIGECGVTVPEISLQRNIYAHFWAAPVIPAYTDAVRGLLRDKAGRGVMSAKGPFHVRTFSWAKAAEQVMEIVGAKEMEAVA